MPVRLLIVDDDTAFRTAIAAALHDRGYEIAGQAGTVAEARVAIAHLRPDAVLLDVNLPDGNGISLAAELAPSGLRIVLTSSDSAAPPTRLLGRSGAAAFIPKTDLLVADLEAALG
jgi:DNA-binding NarL/FixJ family response regulator